MPKNGRESKMLYREFKVGDKEYKLRLSAQIIIDLEKKLNNQLLNVLMNDNEMPSIEVLLLILHGALQKYHHGIDLKAAYAIYDEYVDNGGTYTDLIKEILEVFKVSGFFSQAQVDAQAQAEAEGKTETQENL